MLTLRRWLRQAWRDRVPCAVDMWSAGVGVPVSGRAVGRRRTGWKEASDGVRRLALSSSAGHGVQLRECERRGCTRLPRRAQSTVGSDGSVRLPVHKEKAVRAELQPRRFRLTAGRQRRTLGHTRTSPSSQEVVIKTYLHKEQSYLHHSTVRRPWPSRNVRLPSGSKPLVECSGKVLLHTSGSMSHNTCPSSRQLLVSRHPPYGPLLYGFAVPWLRR
jgi:hypothetical protein